MFTRVDVTSSNTRGYGMVVVGSGDSGPCGSRSVFDERRSIISY